MKNVIIAVLVLILLACCEKKTSGPAEAEPAPSTPSLRQTTVSQTTAGMFPIPASYSIVLIEGCEYVVVSRSESGSKEIAICHKGNCAYCMQRGK